MYRELIYDPDTGVFTWPTGEQAGHCAKADGYRRIEYQGRKYLAHRLAWYFHHGDWPLEVIDHIDGNKDNNAISNLRSVSQTVNLQNMRVVRNKYGLLGVQTGRRGKFRARIIVNKREVYLGEFDTPEAAHNAYMEAKGQYHKTTIEQGERSSFAAMGEG